MFVLVLFVELCKYWFFVLYNLEEVGFGVRGVSFYGGVFGQYFIFEVGVMDVLSLIEILEGGWVIGEGDVFEG